MSDPYFDNVALLLHLDGANGSTVFTDSSNNNLSVTGMGSAQISTAQSKFGGASARFSTSLDYLKVPSQNIQPENFDYTIEFFIRFDFASYTIFLTFTPGGGAAISPFRLDFLNSAGSYLRLRPLVGNSDLSNWHSTATGNTLLEIYTWYHIAITKSGTTVRSFINGVLDLTISDCPSSFDLSTFPDLGIGGFFQNFNTFALQGNVDEFRITKGVARYTENFTPPTQPFPEGPTEAIISDSGPLGAPNVLGVLPIDLLLSVPSMLGAPSVLVDNHLVSLASVPSPLGNPNPLAWHLFGTADIPSPLGSSTPLLFHDFTGQLGDATTYYVMDLTGPSGTTRVPISSWQATLQVGQSNYVQCVVPAVQAYASAIEAADAFVISRLVSVPGVGDLTYEMAAAPVQTATFDQGPSRYTCTLSGYNSGFAPDEDPSSAYDRTLQNIRSVSISQSGVRVRCSIDWLLRPAMRVTAGARTFIVAYINYYVGNNDAYMDVGERA